MPGIIIEPMKAVYWPIPKNACTALKIHFARMLGIPTWGNIHTAPFPLTNDPIEGYENFAFVRNPYSRVFSLWLNKIAPGHPVAPDFVDELDPYVFGRLTDIIHSGMPFSEFITALLNQDRVIDPHWQAQVDQIPEGCTCYKLEEVADAMRHLIPVHNENPPKMKWTDAYNARLKSFVYEYYKRGFLKLGYSRYGY